MLENMMFFVIILYYSLLYYFVLYYVVLVGIKVWEKYIK